MTKTILFEGGEGMPLSLQLDLNGLYHPIKQPITALGIVSSLVPLFGFGWQAMTQDPQTQLRYEIGKRVNKRRTDEANLILILQLAAMFDCHEVDVTLPYDLSTSQLSMICARLPRWQVSLAPLQLQARRLADDAPCTAKTHHLSN
ncbi:MAG: hypothetical protein ACRDBT_07805 [Aeromonas sp.]